MNKRITIAILGIGLLVTSGCCNGPFRQLWRGGECNTCTPWLGRGLFRWGQDAHADCPTCGQAGTLTAPSTGGEIIVPGGTSGNFVQPDGQFLDPYAGQSTTTPGGQNMGVLPRPR